tara:strand:+ start:5597 stop:5947 length:351 start_codon:yes stop_codon:yes gene_type:complete
MDDEYECMRDILEESERKSIRNTLVSIVADAFKPSTSTSKVDVDPYKREASIWIQKGMKWEDAHNFIQRYMGLKCEPSPDSKTTMVCATPGSNRYAALLVSLTDTGLVETVSFDNT